MPNVTESLATRDTMNERTPNVRSFVVKDGGPVSLAPLFKRNHHENIVNHYPRPHQFSPVGTKLHTEELATLSKFAAAEADTAIPEERAELSATVGAGTSTAPASHHSAQDQATQVCRYRQHGLLQMSLAVSP